MSHLRFVLNRRIAGFGIVLMPFWVVTPNVFLGCLTPIIHHFATLSGVIVEVTSPVRIALMWGEVYNDTIRCKTGSVWFIVCTALANSISGKVWDAIIHARLVQISWFLILDYNTRTFRVRNATMTQILDPIRRRLSGKTRMSVESIRSQRSA